MKRICVNILLSLISIFIVLLVTEAIVHFVYRKQIAIFPRNVTNVTYGNFQIRGNIPKSKYWHKTYDGKWQFTINKNGFRDTDDFEYTKKDGEFRILLLGDSFTIGYEVDQDKTYGSILEKYLKSRNFQAEVLNAGVSGYGTAEELVFLENEGIRYQPDVIVLGYYHNDDENNVTSNLYKLAGDRLVMNCSIYLPAIRLNNLINSFGILRWISGNSYLYNYLRSFASNIILKKIRNKNLKSLRNVATGHNVNGQIQSVAQDYEAYLTIALLKRTYEFSKKNGAFFIILDIPSANLHRSLNPSSINCTIDDICDVFIDTSKYLLPYKEREFLYRKYGHGHWTEISHRISSEELGKVILEKAKRKKVD